MKNCILGICVFCIFLNTSCIKDLLEDAPPPPIEDNTLYLRTNTIFGFTAPSSGCLVESCVKNITDTSFFSYHKSGGLKQIFIGNKGGRIDYTYNVDGRLLYIRRYDDDANFKKMQIFYNPEKTKMLRVEISTFDKIAGNSIDTVYAEYPANFPKIILYSKSIREGRKNAVSVCYYDLEGSITTIERGFRDPDTKEVDVRSVETFLYNTTVGNPYNNNVHADYLMLTGTMPGIEETDRTLDFLGKYATASYSVSGSDNKYLLLNKTLTSEGVPETITYENELNIASVFEFTYECE